MFKTRLLSGIVLVIAAIFLIVTGNEVLLFSTLLISCIGMFELFRVFKFEKSLLSVVPYIACKSIYNAVFLIESEYIHRHLVLKAHDRRCEVNYCELLLNNLFD